MDGYEQLLNAYAHAIAEKYFIKDMLAEWKKYKNSKARQSKWRTKSGQLIPVCDLSNSHIHNILHYNFPNPLPDEWRKLLETELQFRNIDFDYYYNELLKYNEIINIGNKAL